MKVSASKNKQTIINKFAKSILSSEKKKNVKGGSDPIIFEDVINM